MAPGDSSFWLALVINHSLHFTSIINIPTEPESFYVNTVTCWKVTIVNLHRQQFLNFGLPSMCVRCLSRFQGVGMQDAVRQKGTAEGKFHPEIKSSRFTPGLTVVSAFQILLFPTSCTYFSPIIAFSKLNLISQTPVNPKHFTKKQTLSVLTLQWKHWNSVSCLDWVCVGLSTWKWKSRETRQPGGGLRGRGQRLARGVEGLFSTTVCSSTHCLKVEASKMLRVNFSHSWWVNLQSTESTFMA